MRNRRRQLTPLAVIVELHVVFLSFQKVFCPRVCMWWVHLYVCVPLCVIYVCVLSRSLVAPSLTLSCIPLSLSFAPSFSLSFHLSHSQFALVYGVTCDRFLIRREGCGSPWFPGRSRRRQTRLTREETSLEATSRRTSTPPSCGRRANFARKCRRIGNRGEDSFKKETKECVDDDLPSTVRDDFSCAQRYRDLHQCRSLV